MEDRVRLFLEADTGYSYGHGSGIGSGGFEGYGYGACCGEDDGSGVTDFVEFNSDGSGDGSGSGSGFGLSSGRGRGRSYDIKNMKSYKGDDVHIIDDLNTVITNVNSKCNVARGYIIKLDLTTEETFVVKERGYFAHGRTLHEAVTAVHAKVMANSSIEERIEEFVKQFPEYEGKKYDAKDLFEWHHILTGSCLQGRRAFCAEKGIDVSKDTFSVKEFVRLTEKAYGGEVIVKLKTAYGHG